MDGVAEQDCNRISWNSWICQLQLIAFDSVLAHSIFLFNVEHYAHSLCLFRLKKTKKIIATAVNYQVGACGEDGTRLSLVLCIRTIRENREIAIFCKGKTESNFTMRIVRDWDRLPGGFIETSSLRILKTWLNNFRVTYLTFTILCFEWGVGPDDLHRSCQLKFMSLWLYTFLLDNCQWDIRNQINNRSFWTVSGFLAV